jgi:hypothetical protein
MCPKTLTNTRKQLKQKRYKSAILLRCSQPLSTNQTPHPTTKMERQHHRPPTPNRPADNTQVLSQDPTVCLAIMLPPRKEFLEGDSLLCTQPPPTTDENSTRLTPPPIEDVFVVLLRKEVIQPHLPVRLPCYDFVPIADPTFDSSPHKG